MIRLIRKACPAVLTALWILAFSLTQPPLVWEVSAAAAVQTTGKAVPAGIIVKASGDFTYTTSGGAATITGYAGTATNLTIPSVIDGLPVVAIGNAAFESKNLLSVSIPGSVKVIGDNAFSSCEDLASVTLSSGLEKIGYRAFSYNEALKGITIPGTVKEIAEWAFFRCDSLESVALSSGLETIGEYAFFYDKALKQVSIPGTVKDIGEKAFSDCSAITVVTLSSGIERIGKSAFAGCIALTSIAVPGTVKEIPDYVFSGCNSLVSAVLPNGIEQIGNYAFYGASKLAAIAIPGSVNTIDEWAFSNCVSLASVTLNSGLESIGYGAFSYCNSLKSISIPGTVESIGSPNFVYLYNTFGAFSNCTSLQSVTLASGLKTICAQSFLGCTALTGVTIPDSVTSIRESAFAGCTSLASVVMSRNLTEIRGSAFLGCALKSVTLYDKLGTIGYKALANNEDLQDVTVYSRSLTYGDEVFSGCSADLVVVGSADSATEEYALSHGIEFEAIGTPSHATLAMSASTVKPGLNNPVTFTVGNAKRATKARLAMGGNHFSDEAAVLNGAATIRQAFHTSGTERIALQLYKSGAWVDGGAGAKVLKVKSAAKLSTPSLTRPSDGTLYVMPGNGAALAWKGVKRAVRYVVTAFNPANAVIWTGELQTPSVTIPGSEFASTGNYRVRIYAQGNDVQQSGTRTLVINVVDRATVSLSSSTVSPGLNNPVTFTVSGAVGASKARLVINGSELTEAVSVSSKTRQAVIRKAFHVSGAYTVSLQLYRNKAWEDGGAGTKALTVFGADTMPTPVLEKPVSGALRTTTKKGASITWKSVANAAKYLIVLYNAQNNSVWTAETDKRSVSIPKSALAKKGVYRAEIYALGNNVQRSMPGAICTITVS